MLEPARERMAPRLDLDEERGGPLAVRVSRREGLAGARNHHSKRPDVGARGSSSPSSTASTQSVPGGRSKLEPGLSVTSVQLIAAR